MRLRIEKAIYGGAGLARADGKSVFVPFALPGEVVEAHAAAESSSYTTAELDEVIEAAAQRTEAPCPYFGACGGCHYQHATYSAQVLLKTAILRETLERGRVRGIPEIVPVTGGPLGYRNRVRLHVRGKPFSLCYKMRNSHVNLPVSACSVAAPVLQRTITALNVEGQRLGIGRWAREVEFFANADESAMLAALWTDLQAQDARQKLQQCWPGLRECLPAMVGAGVFSSATGRRASSLLAQMGEGALQYRCGERLYRVSLGSFFQVNRFLIGDLVRLVTENEGGGAAWDLYAGAGLFSVPLGAQFERVTAVESAAGSVRDLRENLHGSTHRVVASETAAFLRHAVERQQTAPDLVVVDPPRAGLGKDVTSLLAKLRPRKITYVSCDPATLSRDLAALLESGYRLRTMHLVDLFPQTFHLESVTHLLLD